MIGQISVLPVSEHGAKVAKVARAGEGLERIGRVFRYLKEIVPLSC
jgi:hypothetical protein